MELEVKQEKQKLEIWGNINFLVLVIASFFSTLSFSAYEMIEAWYVVNYLNKEAFLGIVLILTTVPRLFFMIIGGALADKYNPVKIMTITSLLRLIVLVLMAILFHLSLLNIWVLMFFAFVFGMLDAYFWPASSSILPAIVSKEILTRANAIMRSGVHISMLLGPIIFALIITSFSYTITFIILSITVLFSLLPIIFIKSSIQEKEKNENSLIKDVTEGFVYIRRSRSIFSFIIIFIFFNFLFMGPVGLGAPLIANNVLKGDAMVLAYLDSGWAIGLLFGSIITGLINLNRKRGITVMLLLLLVGILTILFGQVSFVTGSVAIIFLMGVCISMVNIPIYSYVQENTEESKLGRVMSLLNISSNGLVPLSFATVSLLISLGIEFSFILSFSGALLILFCLIVLIFVKNIRTAN